MKIATLAIVIAASAQYVLAAPVRSDAICAVVKQRVATIERPKTVGPASGWWCDFVAEQYQPRRFWVVGLHSGDVQTGSDLMGWYALRRKDGRVFSWDISNDGPGTPL